MLKRQYQPRFQPLSVVPRQPGVLRAAGAGSGRGLYADVVRVLSHLSADPDPGAHLPRPRAPGLLRLVPRGDPFRQDHGLQGGLHRPLALWVRGCG